MARYECTLSPDLLKKARTELNEPEDNSVRLAAIDKLKTRFQEQVDDLQLLRTDDAFLLRFLRVRKFDHEKAFTTLVNYHKHRKNYRDIFDLVDNPKLMANFLDYGPIIPLNERAVDGTYVIIGRPGLGFKESTDVIKFFSAVFLTVEKLLEEEELQVHGVTVIQDMAQFGVTNAMQMAANASRFFEIIQDSMPIRVKSVNMVNEALVFDILWTIAKQFMKDKLKNRLEVHGADYTKLHKKVDVKYLPPFLGGTGSLNAEKWKKEVISTVGVGEDTSL